MVGLLGRVISPSQGLYLHRKTQHRKTRTNIHALSGTRTHDPRNQPAKTHASYRTATVTGKIVFYYTRNRGLHVAVGMCYILLYYDGVRLSLWNWAANGPIFHPPDDTWVNLEQWWNAIERGKPKDLDTYLSYCHVVHHRCPRSKPSPSS
jgi:hypothetical protein